MSNYSYLHQELVSNWHMKTCYVSNWLSTTGIGEELAISRAGQLGNCSVHQY